jgi:endogenous inhibitor of DNA gyrase (YacG/DUF329 family)
MTEGAKLFQPRRACPICGKPRVERYNPFCSKRCADIDLSRWLKGVYVIPTDEEGDTEPRLSYPGRTNNEID